MPNWGDRIEIRVHGRGGQGTVTLAALIVDAAFRSGKQALGFPTFGTERTGAPVAAYVRLDITPILDRSEVHRPTFVLVQDPTLIGAIDVAAGLVPGGLILLNAERVPDGLAGMPVATLPATALALEHLGSAKTSTAMLGFFTAVTGITTMDAVCDAIRDRFVPAIAEPNVVLARAAFAAAEPARPAA